MNMWDVYEHRRVAKKLQSLPLEIQKRYEKWKDIVGISGPAGLRLIRGFRDEALGGKWKAHRSSRLGLQYRVIYKVFGQKVLVLVINITAHDYRRT
jgi:proteic killer suppression protein